MGSFVFENALPRQVFLHLMLDLTNAERSLPGDPGDLEPTKRTNERQGVPAAATKVATGDVLGVPPIYL